MDASAKSPPSLDEQLRALPILPDRAVSADSVPWVRLSDGVDYKPLRFDFATGVWVNVLRVAPGARLGRHRHNGGPVLGYCLAGRWWYLEREWVAEVGTFVYEPPGDIHTLVAGPEGMTTLFVTDGVLQFFDEHDRLDHEDNAFSRYQGYVDHCHAHDLEMVDLTF
jgi:quercetin dioxygenase-like cupin family protein